MQIRQRIQRWRWRRCECETQLSIFVFCASQKYTFSLCRIRILRTMKQNWLQWIISPTFIRFSCVIVMFCVVIRVICYCTTWSCWIWTLCMKICHFCTKKNRCNSIGTCWNVINTLYLHREGGAWLILNHFVIFNDELDLRRAKNIACAYVMTF